MAQALSLNNYKEKITKLGELPGGFEVPWEVEGYQKEFYRANEKGGYFDLSYLRVIEIEGPDTVDYLQRMSTANFKTLPKWEIVDGAFLTGKGGLITLGWFYRDENKTYYLCAPCEAERALTHIEQFHFAEDFSVKDVSADWSLIGLWNTDGGSLSLPEQVSQIREESKFRYWKDKNREPLCLLKFPRSEWQKVETQIEKNGISLLGQRLFEYFRIQARCPQLERELKYQDLILEANFDQSVARNKGCYPGQEVVERIFTYGSVNKKLMGVSLKAKDETAIPEYPIPIKAEGVSVGKIVSAVSAPTDPTKYIGFAMVDKKFWEHRTPFTTESGFSDVHLVR